MKYKILTVVGTRPNFIKITQFPRVAKEYPNLDLKIVHTGQHSDHGMAQVFFDQFGFNPDYYLNIESKIPASQIGEMIMQLSDLIQTWKPDMVLVVGDVNSTLAGALSAHKSGIAFGHVESGLRSGDLSMPEENNRIITDHLADIYFITEQSGINNLRLEGKRKNLFLVGNTMIDTMVAFDKEIQSSLILGELQIEDGDYCLMTMHRPSTVDSKEGLLKMISLIQAAANSQTVLFPIHPRTRNNLKIHGMEDQINSIPNLRMCDPVDYFSFQKLISSSKFILTDSGGIQEESTFRGIPCLTLRDNTERPSTIELGSNNLVPMDQQIIREQIQTIESGDYKKGEVPPLWDGRATDRIFKTLVDFW